MIIQIFKNYIDYDSHFFIWSKNLFLEKIGNGNVVF